VGETGNAPQEEKNEFQLQPHVPGGNKEKREAGVISKGENQKEPTWLEAAAQNPNRKSKKGRYCQHKINSGRP